MMASNFSPSWTANRWPRRCWWWCLLIGIVDVVFAVDSIPAIFAITTDSFIVLTSNVLAIPGLRAMYFLLAGMHDRFHLLPYGRAIVLVLIGTKMLLIDIYKISV